MEKFEFKDRIRFDKLESYKLCVKLDHWTAGRGLWVGFRLLGY